MTHKGRDSSSGHYIAFVRKEGSDAAPAGGKAGAAKEESWLVFDDDSVESTTAEVVSTRLKGGGDDLCVVVGGGGPAVLASYPRSASPSQHGVPALLQGARLEMKNWCAHAMAGSSHARGTRARDQKHRDKHVRCREPHA